MHAAARLSAPAFLDRYREAITKRRIRIGCSFAPEQFDSTADDGGVFALQALRVAVEEYGIADVRIGLRWNHLAPDGPRFTDYYEALIDYCFTAPGVTHVCLDLGPIKTFRWPEVHVPQAVLTSLPSLPPRGATIEPESELAQTSFQHFARALQYVGERHGGRKPVSFCFNEAFHSFGPLGWTMSERYVAALVHMVERCGYFPGAGFVLNSSEGRQLDRIADFYERLVQMSPELAGRLTSGFDFYPFLPRDRAVPRLEASMRWARTAWLWARHPSSRSIRRANEGVARYRIEVTEAQAEPWGIEQTVGNSLARYQHVLAESMDRILNPLQPDSIIRMWGVEYQLERVLRRTGVPANQQILDLTREINSLAR